MIFFIIPPQELFGCPHWRTAPRKHRAKPAFPAFPPIYAICPSALLPKKEAKALAPARFLAVASQRKYYP
jgi:hypothetical protein